MSDNPYSAPVVSEEGVSESSLGGNADSKTFGSIAKATFLAWEKLRIAFVLVLGLVTLALAGTTILEPKMIFLIVAGAVFANVCFFAGPIVETYVRWLGYTEQWVRWFLFIGGTLLTALLAVATLVSANFPGQL